MKDGNFENVNL